MLSLWNLYLLLPLSLPFLLHVTVLTGENVKETQQPDTDTAVQRLSQPSQRRHGSGLTAASPMLATENVDFLSLSWHLSSPEESDSQGVIGEYTDLQEGTETSPLHPHEKGPTYSAQPIKSSSGGVPPPPAQDQQTLKYQPGETSTGSLLQSTQTGEIQPSFPAKQNETTDSQLPFILPGSLPSEQDSTSLLFAGPGPSPEHPTPPVSTGRLGWTSDPPVITQGKTQEGIAPVKETGGELIDITDHILHRGAVRIEEDKGKSLSLNKMSCFWIIHHSQKVTPITVNVLSVMLLDCEW